MVKSGSDDFGKCVFSKKLTSHWPEFQHEESHFHLQRFSFSFVHLLFIFWAVHVYHGLSSSFIFSWIHLIASWSYVSDENGSNYSRGQVPCDISKIKQWFLSARNKYVLWRQSTGRIKRLKRKYDLKLWLLLKNEKSSPQVGVYLWQQLVPSWTWLQFLLNTN